MLASVEPPRTVQREPVTVWHRPGNRRQACQPDRKNLLERFQLGHMARDQDRFHGVRAGATDAFDQLTSFQFNIFRHSET